MQHRHVRRQNERKPRHTWQVGRKLSRSLAQVHCPLKYRLEHRLEVTLRGIDDPRTSAVAVRCSRASASLRSRSAIRCSGLGHVLSGVALICGPRREPQRHPRAQAVVGPAVRSGITRRRQGRYRCGIGLSGGRWRMPGRSDGAEAIDISCGGRSAQFRYPTRTLCALRSAAVAAKALRASRAYSEPLLMPPNL